jgi:hypothetical protein
MHGTLWYIHKKNGNKQEYKLTLTDWLIMLYNGVRRLWTAAITGHIVHPLMIHEYGQRRWNDTDRGNPKNSEKTLSQRHLVHHKSHMDWTKREPAPPR